MQNSRIDLPQEQNIPQWQKLVIYLMIAIAFFTLWASLYAPIFDGDIWFHLLYGKAILENHTLTPDHTIYSWTPSSNDSIYCSWLGQVFYYLLYKYFGNGGIIVFRYLAASSLFFVILVLARQRNTFYNPIVWLSATLCILIMELTIQDKPESFSFVLMVLLVLIWYKIKLAKQQVLYFVYCFPLIILIWVNIHGAFVFGCLFLLCIGIGETLNQLIYKDRALSRRIYYNLLLSLFLSVGCIFLTPYGLKYISQIISGRFDDSLSSDISHVQAYVTTFEIGGVRLPLFADIAIIILVIMFILSLRKKQLDFVPVLSNLVFAFLFTRYARTTFLWVPVFSLSVVYYANSFFINNERRRSLFTGFIGLVNLVLCGWILYQAQYYPSKGRWLDFGLSESFAIDDEINYIEKHYNHAKLGNVYDHGAYILWKKWPEFKVMIDARYFPYREIYRNYLDFEYGRNIDGFIKKYPFDVIEIKHSSIVLLQWFFRSNDWVLVFYGKGAAVFVRNGNVHSAAVVRGDSLGDIKEFGTGLTVFNASLIFKDWMGTDIILMSMKKQFKHQYQQEMIKGLNYIRLADETYAKKDYSLALEYINNAIEQKTNNPNLYAAILLMKANEDWNNEEWGLAIENAIKSWKTKNTFAASYNIALMAYQIEKMQKSDMTLNSLNINTTMVIPLWRKNMQDIADNIYKCPSHYVEFAENAKKIIEGSFSYSTKLAEPDWR